MIRDIINSMGTERELSPWVPSAFNDITWTELHSERGTSGVGKSYARRHYPSLSKPNTYWLEYFSETSGAIGKHVRSTLRSTQDVVALDTAYNILGNIKSRSVRINNGPNLQFKSKNNDWLLVDESENLLARFQRGAISERFPLNDSDLAFLGGPDDPHVYDKVFVKGELLAEMIVPNNGITFARFKHRPLVPYMRNVPESHSREQAGILLAMLFLPIIY